jgi:hypothetical protein
VFGIKSSLNAARNKTASKRKRAESSVERKQSPGTPKKYRYECTAGGYTNIVKQGGVCKKYGMKAGVLSREQQWMAYNLTCFLLCQPKPSLHSLTPPFLWELSHQFHAGDYL